MADLARPLPTATSRRRVRGWWRRVLRDPVLAATLALLIPVALVAGGGVRHPPQLIALVVAYVVIQVGITLALPRRVGRSLARLRSVVRWMACIAFLAGAELVTDASTVLAVAYIPVIGLAASQSRPQAVAAVLMTSLVHTTVDLVEGSSMATVIAGGLGYGSIAALAAVIVRLQVARLQVSHDRLRRAVTGDRRRARQIASVEAIGRILATSGPSDEALDRVVRRIVAELGYQYVSVYLSEGGPQVRLRAQHGYGQLVEEFDGSRGIVGRVMRTRRPAFVPDVSADPEYWGINPDVRSEICVPLVADDEFLGFINVESTDVTPLDATDLRTMVAIADRLAAALVIGHERQALSARVELFRQLHRFSETINSTLETEQLYDSIVSAVRGVVPADITALCVLDRESGRYYLRAIDGAEVELGIEVRPGEGMAGRAIRDRTLIIDERFSASRYPGSIMRQDPRVHEAPPMQAAAVPLVRDRAVVGALTVLRRDVRQPFTDLERDALSLVAEQASLAVANAFLHAEVQELAIRDPLTGCFNRRYLEPAMQQLWAQRQRHAPEERPPLSVIMFDLDHFSELNNRYGHRAGDAVLRAFAEVLRARLRATDLVARIGGEEFAAILYRTGAVEAMRVADEVREAFADRAIVDDDGALLTATVSAGCTEADNEKTTPEALLRAADVALYMAKRSGRNRVVAA